MEYKRFGNTVVVRIDRGEEIIEQLRRVALSENIKLAQISALGATDLFTVGVYDPVIGEYTTNEFSGEPFEIVSLTGTVNTMLGDFYCHLHMSAGDKSGRVFGGHLSRAVISATCEMIINIIDGCVDRARDPETGLNLFDFI